MDGGTTCAIRVCRTLGARAAVRAIEPRIAHTCGSVRRALRRYGVWRAGAEDAAEADLAWSAKGARRVAGAKESRYALAAGEVGRAHG